MVPQQKRRPGPKSVTLPADAVTELELVASSIEAKLRSWPKDARYRGIRRGLGDALETVRRRAARIRKAQIERFEVVDLRSASAPASPTAAIAPPTAHARRRRP